MAVVVVAVVLLVVVVVLAVPATKVHPQSAAAEVVQVTQVDLGAVWADDVVDDLHSDLLQ